MSRPITSGESHGDVGNTEATAALHTPHPRAFAEQLGVSTWAKLEEIYDAIASGKRKILVRSCNGAGKTTAIAALCNWKLSQPEETIVLTTASSWTQVRRTLWGEIRKQARLAALYKDSAISSTSIKIDDKHYALGISPCVPENAQGFHAPNIFIAVDEATGVSEEIMDALMGNATDRGAQIVLIYNPINLHSFPYKAEASGEWHLIAMSAFDHPNVISGEDVIPGAVTRAWIEDRLKCWSYEVEPDSNNALLLPWNGKSYYKTPRVLSRILGEWADENGNGLIDVDLIERSYSIEPRSGLRAIGIDVSRGGEDETVFAFFDGNRQLPFVFDRSRDLMRVADKAKEYFDQGWNAIAVDDTGVGGGVTDRLRNLGVPVIPINFASVPRGVLQNEKGLLNARAEMYFLLEEELRQQRVRLLDDKLLLQELTSIGARYTQSNLYLLEPKEKVKRRIGRSPDRADATVLARYAAKLHTIPQRTKTYFL